MVANRLSDIREDHDIKQIKMAKILKVKRSTYSMWEVGINIIPIEALYNFAEYYELSLDYVIGLNNNRKHIKFPKKFDLKLLGINLKKYRKMNKLTQKQVADYLNVSESSIYKYEKGLNCISTTNLCMLCKKYNKTLDELCGLK